MGISTTTTTTSSSSSSTTTTTLTTTTASSSSSTSSTTTTNWWRTHGYRFAGAVGADDEGKGFEEGDDVLVLGVEAADALDEHLVHRAHLSSFASPTTARVRCCLRHPCLTKGERGRGKPVLGGVFAGLTRRKREDDGRLQRFVYLFGHPASARLALFNLKFGSFMCCHLFFLNRFDYFNNCAIYFFHLKKYRFTNLNLSFELLI